MREDTAALMGRGATREFDRVAASLGELEEAAVKFQHLCDVNFGGVMFALPALLSNGLINNTNEYFKLPKGYYGLVSLLIILAYLVLLRIKTPEQIKKLPPGEIGKCAGLDRIPEVKTIRRKLDTLAKNGDVERWQKELSIEWMKRAESLAGYLYVDGHVSVYNGKKVKLPRRYVARERLCLRGLTDYWVNDAIGQPYFLVRTVQTSGLIAMLTEEIVPKLLSEVPNQPTKYELKMNQYKSRFVIIFDREGYSPEFMLKMWKQRISCITYTKYPDGNWPEEEFRKEEVKMHTGEHVEMELAERGTYIGNCIWVREIRKKSKSGHQTSLISTDYISNMNKLAVAMFSRWSQENFFKYMIQHFGIDKIIEYDTTELDDTLKFVNPKHRDLDKKVRSKVSKLQKRQVKFAKLTLKDIESKNVKKYEQNKGELQEEIVQFQKEIEELKEKRKAEEKHIKLSEFSEDEKYGKLSDNRKQVMDTIKMISYRAETSLATLIKPIMSHKDEARTLLRHIFMSDIDLKPDEKNGVLEVILHNMANPLSDKIAQFLCKKLNETEIKSPGTDLRLVYKMLSSNFDKNTTNRITINETAKIAYC